MHVRVLALCVILYAGFSAPADAPQRLTSRPAAKTLPVPGLRVGDELRTDAGERRRVALPDGASLFLNERTRVKLDGERRLTLSGGELLIAGRKQASPLVIKTPANEARLQDAAVAVRAEPRGDRIVVVRGRAELAGSDQPLLAGQQMDALGRPAAARELSQVLDWTRELLSAGESLVPGSEHAGGALVAVDPNGQEAKLEMRKFHVDVHIEDGFARTTIDQTYFNNDPWQMEGTFYFPLPPDASLSRLAMYVDGQLMEGGMAERDHARVVYESIRYMQRDPALLEWVDGSTFKMRVFPIEGRKEKRIILSYTQRLPSLYGQLTYRFPAGHSLQKVKEWGLHALVKNGAGMTWSCSSHDLKSQTKAGDLELMGAARNTKTDRDIVLSLTPARQDSGEPRFSAMVHEGQQYLMFRHILPSPPVLQGRGAGGAGGANHYTILFESSGDRDPLLARVQIEVLRHFLGYVEPGDTFSVLTAGARVRSLNAEALPATPDNIDAAMLFLEGSHLIGALDLAQALRDVGQTFLSANKSSYLLHLGSGIAAMGERRDDVLAGLIPKETKYVGIGVGKRWNRGLMKAAAERTGGSYTQINPDEAIAWRAFELFAKLNTPRLLAIQAFDQAAKHRFHLFDQAVAQGEEICGITRIEPGAEFPKAVVLQGVLAGQPFEQTLPVKNIREQAEVLPRMWARLQIEHLLLVDPVKNKDEVIALSKAMYVMSPYTSLLVLENEDMYKQYNVDRGRKDHWAMYPAPPKIPVVYEPLEGMKKAGERRAAKEVLGTIVKRESPRLLSKANGSRSGFDDILVTLESATTGSFMVGGFGAVPAMPVHDSSIALNGRGGVVKAFASGGVANIGFTTGGDWSAPVGIGQILIRGRLESDGDWAFGLRHSSPLGFRANHTNRIANSGTVRVLALQPAESSPAVRVFQSIDGSIPGSVVAGLRVSVGLRQIQDDWDRFVLSDSPPQATQGGVFQNVRSSVAMQARALDLLTRR